MVPRHRHQLVQDPASFCAPRPAVTHPGRRHHLVTRHRAHPPHPPLRGLLPLGSMSDEAMRALTVIAALHLKPLPSQRAAATPATRSAAAHVRVDELHAMCRAGRLVAILDMRVHRHHVQRDLLQRHQSGTIDLLEEELRDLGATKSKYFADSFRRAAPLERRPRRCL
jgi:hypothetical protein